MPHRTPPVFWAIPAGCRAPYAIPAGRVTPGALMSATVASRLCESRAKRSQCFSTFQSSITGEARTPVRLSRQAVGMANWPKGM